MRRPACLPIPRGYRRTGPVVVSKHQDDTSFPPVTPNVPADCCTCMPMLAPSGSEAYRQPVSPQVHRNAPAAPPASPAPPCPPPQTPRQCPRHRHRTHHRCPHPRRTHFGRRTYCRTTASQPPAPCRCHVPGGPCRPLGLHGLGCALPLRRGPSCRRCPSRALGPSLAHGLRPDCPPRRQDNNHPGHALRCMKCRFLHMLMLQVRVAVLGRFEQPQHWATFGH